MTAVCICHENNIMHRDIKPENIMLHQNVRFDQPRKIYLINFREAYKFKPGEKLSKMCGTAYYVAPEVINKEYD